jgi:Cu-Zn family superoxide dismutase
LLLPLLFIALTVYGINGNSQGPNTAGSQIQMNYNSTDNRQDKNEQTVMSEIVDMVSVELINSKGKKVGKALLTQEEKGVRIKLEALNLPPGKHGFHIHETGKCEVSDFKSAGGHFNSYGNEHGLENPKGPHAGDMPNIDVASDGTISIEIFNPRVSLEKGKVNSLLKPGGTALMIHEKADDMLSNPSGHAGNRIACGVIKQ